MQRTIIILAYFFICADLAAQQYSFVRFTSENGLSNNVVYSTQQDSRGYLWIATHDGLNRYDGYEFKKFLHSPFNKRSLASNMTIDLAEDNDGNLWVLTNTHLHCYNQKNNLFERYILPVGSTNHSQQSASKLINANKRLLLINLFNGLFVFDKLSKHFDPISIDAASIEKPDLFNFGFFKDKEGNILIGAGSAKGVLAFDSASLTLKRDLPYYYRSIKWQNEIVTSIYRNKKNKLIYCVQEGNKFYLTSERGQKHFLLNRSLAGITIFIESISEDEQGNIWIGCNNRLFEYKPDLDMVIDRSINLYSTSIGNNFIIKSICIDNFSNLWLGLYEAGLMKASIRKSLFWNFAISQPGSLKLPYSSIYDVMKNPDETIIVRYFGTPMASLIDVTNKKIITEKFRFNPLDNSSMKKLFPQFKQITTPKPFYKFFHTTTRFNFNNGQFALYKDRQQDYWAVSFNEFTRIKDTLTFNTSDHINCFYEDDEHTFWVGTDGNGLIQLNYKTGRIKKFIPNESDQKSISSDYVNNIIPADSKGLWLATRYGLNYFDLQTQQFKLYSEEDGLGSNTIYAMEKDKDGKLWLGTSNGLSSYDPHTNEFTNYSKNNGLINPEYNRNGTVRLNNGWIVMGGTEGIDVIIPDSIKYIKETEKRSPPLLITGFRSQDSSYTSFADPIRLRHQQNNIEISFAALDLTQPYNNKYAWKLEPIDRKWIYGLGKHEVNYAGLPPGSYTFKIKGTGSGGAWNSKETSLAFIISPPWWQSWWMTASIILLSIFLLVAILRFYYHRKLKKQLEKQKVILEKQQLLEKERARIAADMHDDLGAGLTKIKYITEHILEKTDSGETIQPELEKLKGFSSELVESMGEIIWAISEKNNLLSNTLYYLRSYAVNYCEENELDCHFELPENFKDGIVSGNIRRNIFLLMKESLHNIVKHAQANSVTIKVTISETLNLIISDDGKGFSENGDTKGNGLINMKKRIHELNGTIEFKNNIGTTIIIGLPFATNQSTIG